MKKTHGCTGNQHNMAAKTAYSLTIDVTWSEWPNYDIKTLIRQRVSGHDERVFRSWDREVFIAKNTSVI